MEAGQFNNINEAVSKFINTSTEVSTTSQAQILYYNKRHNFNNYRGRGRGRGRQNYRNQNNRQGNSYRNSYQTQNNDNRFYRGNRNVRVITENPENDTVPQIVDLGDA